jgi:hypothetical protein
MLEHGEETPLYMYKNRSRTERFIHNWNKMRFFSEKDLIYDRLSIIGLWISFVSRKDVWYHFRNKRFNLSKKSDEDNKPIKPELLRFLMIEEPEIPDLNLMMRNKCFHGILSQDRKCPSEMQVYSSSFNSSKLLGPGRISREEYYSKKRKLTKPDSPQIETKFPSSDNLYSEKDSLSLFSLALSGFGASPPDYSTGK